MFLLASTVCDMQPGLVIVQLRSTPVLRYLRLHESHYRSYSRIPEQFHLFKKFQSHSYGGPTEVAAILRRKLRAIDFAGFRHRE